MWLLYETDKPRNLCSWLYCGTRCSAVSGAEPACHQACLCAHDNSQDPVHGPVILLAVSRCGLQHHVQGSPPADIRAAGYCEESRTGRGEEQAPVHNINSFMYVVTHCLMSAVCLLCATDGRREPFPPGAYRLIRIRYAHEELKIHDNTIAVKQAV